MRVDYDYTLVFFHTSDLGVIAKRLLKATDVVGYPTDNGKLYVGLRAGKAVGCLLVSPEGDFLRAKSLSPSGEVKLFVIFTDEVSVPLDKVVQK